MPQFTYLDLDLRIERVDDSFRVQATPSNGGPGGVRKFAMPFQSAEIDAFLDGIAAPGQVARSAGAVDSAATKAFGQRLYDALFAEQVGEAWLLIADEAQRTAARLRIRLGFADTPELARLPWEYLYQQERDRFLALSTRTPLVRYIDMRERLAPLQVTAPLRILVVIAGPRDMQPLDVDFEWAKLHSALGRLGQLAVVERLDQATLPALQQRLIENDYHVLHFIGHGEFDTAANDGVLYLEDEQTAAVPVTGAQLGALLRDEERLRLVVLNACEGARANATDLFAGTAQSLVRQGVPAVVAMQFPISDAAAIKFTQVFYSTLADNHPVDTAVTEARKLIFSEGNVLEWATPVLFTRAPDGQLFDVTPLPTQAPPPVPGAASAAPPAGAPGPLDEAQLEKLYRDASVLYWTEKWAPAVELLRQIVAVQPQYRDAATRLADAERQQELERLWTAGEAAAAEQRWADAVQAYGAIVVADGAYKDAAAKLEVARRQRQLGMLFDMGVQRMNDGDWAGALGAFQALAGHAADYRNVQALLERARRELAAQTSQAVAPAASPATPGITADTVQQVRCVHVLRDHQKQVNAVAFAHDSRTLASGGGGSVFGGDTAIRLWSVADGVLRTTIANRTGTIYGVAFAPGDQALASGAYDDMVQLWNVADRSPLRTLAGHTNTVYCVAYSPDGQLLVSGGMDNTVRLWRPADATLLRTLAGHTSAVNCVAFSPDGQTVASGAQDKTVRLWNVADGALRGTLSGHDSWVDGVAFSPDGQLLASAAEDTTIRLWHVADGSYRELKGHTGAFGVVSSVAFSPDGQLLVSGGSDATVRIWRVSTGALLQTLEGHDEKVLAVAWSPDGQWLASGSTDTMVRLWRIATD